MQNFSDGNRNAKILIHRLFMLCSFDSMNGLNYGTCWPALSAAYLGSGRGKIWPAPPVLLMVGFPFHLKYMIQLQEML